MALKLKPFTLRLQRFPEEPQKFVRTATGKYPENAFVYPAKGPFIRA
jgi:hypothetical protein